MRNCLLLMYSRILFLIGFLPQAAFPKFYKLKGRLIIPKVCVFPTFAWRNSWQNLACCCSDVHKFLLDGQHQTLKHSQKMYSYTLKFEYVKMKSLTVHIFLFCQNRFLSTGTCYQNIKTRKLTGILGCKLHNLSCDLK